jgi:hypothetical protein
MIEIGQAKAAGDTHNALHYYLLHSFQLKHIYCLKFVNGYLGHWKCAPSTVSLLLHSWVGVGAENAG